MNAPDLRPDPRARAVYVNIQVEGGSVDDMVDLLKAAERHARQLARARGLTVTAHYEEVEW